MLLFCFSYLPCPFHCFMFLFLLLCSCPFLSFPSFLSCLSCLCYTIASFIRSVFSKEQLWKNSSSLVISPERNIGLTSSQTVPLVSCCLSFVFLSCHCPRKRLQLKASHPDILGGSSSRVLKYKFLARARDHSTSHAICIRSFQIDISWIQVLHSVAQAADL